nr:MAG TPA: hypothetical protein [Caudoviricetes sp.]
MSELVAYFARSVAVHSPHASAELCKEECHFGHGVVAHNGENFPTHSLELFFGESCAGRGVEVEVSSELCTDEHSDRWRTEQGCSLVERGVFFCPCLNGFRQCLYGVGGMPVGKECFRAVPFGFPAFMCLRGQSSQ